MATTGKQSMRTGAIARRIAASLAFLFLFAAAASTYVQPAHAATFNVKDYGAAGNGVADDTAAVQAALDAAGRAGGGTVYLPVGTYRVNRLFITRDRVLLTGEGRSSMLISASPSEVIKIQGATTLTGVELRNFGLTGTYANTSQIGVGIYGLRNGRFEKLYIRDCGFSGIYSRGTLEGSIIAGNLIEHAGDFGIQIKAGSVNNAILGNTLRGFASVNYPGHGIYVLDAIDTTVTANVIEDVTGVNSSGIVVSSSLGTLVERNTVRKAVYGIMVVTGSVDTWVRSNTVEDSASSGVYLYQDVTRTEVSDNTILRSGDRGIRLNGDTYPVRETVLRNNLIAGAGRGGVMSAGASDVEIQSNQINPLSTGDIFTVDIYQSSNVTVRQNNVTVTGRGLMARGTCSAIVVDSNTLTDGAAPTVYGIRIERTVTDVRVTNNDLRGILTGVPLSVEAATSYVSGNLLASQPQPGTTTTLSPQTTTTTSPIPSTTTTSASFSTTTTTTSPSSTTTTTHVARKTRPATPTVRSGKSQAATGLFSLASYDRRKASGKTLVLARTVTLNPQAEARLLVDSARVRAHRQPLYYLVQSGSEIWRPGTRARLAVARDR